MPAQKHHFTQPLTRTYLVDIPAGEGPHPLVITCHGYSQRPATMMRFTQLWAKDCVIASLQAPFPHYRTTVAPASGRGYGFGWINSSNPHESQDLHCSALERIIDELIEQGIADQKQIILVGFSQSVSLNYRFAFKGTRKLAGLVALMGGLPHDFEHLSKSPLPPTLLVTARDDVHYSADLSDSFTAALSQIDTPLTLLSYEGSHELPVSLDSDLDSWLLSVRNEESPVQ